MSCIPQNARVALVFGRMLFLLGAVLAQVGCAEPIQLVARAPVSGVSPCSFWPPAPGTATWLVEPDAARHLPMNAVASELELNLRAAGYSEQRWFPIGTGHDHGFAVTTRLERIDGNPPSDPSQRFSSLYREAANLKWLRLARTLPLLQPGRYRVLLIAYTDLSIGRSSIAPTWNEATMMDGPGARESFSARESGIPARLPSNYQFGIYDYEYQWDDSEARATLRPADAAAESTKPPARLVRVVRGASASPHEQAKRGGYGL